MIHKLVRFFTTQNKSHVHLFIFQVWQLIAPITTLLQERLQKSFGANKIKFAEKLRAIRQMTSILLACI